MDQKAVELVRFLLKDTAGSTDSLGTLHHDRFDHCQIPLEGELKDSPPDYSWLLSTLLKEDCLGP
jgi:hypothetical protein